MKLNHIRTLTCMSMLWVAGCAARTTIVANRDASFDKKVSRMFVVSYLNRLEKALTEPFAQEMKLALEARGVETDVANISDIELDTSIYKQRISEFHPDAVLFVQPTQSMSRDFRIVSATIDVSLVDTSSEKRVWRGKVSLWTGSPFREGTAPHALASGIAEKLVEDRMI